MNKSILTTRPRYDPLTEYLYSWSGLVLEMARKKSIQVLDLVGEKAEKDRFESYVNEHNPSFIFLNGHGNSAVIAGQDNKIIVDKTSNLVGCVVYARSCDSANILGEELVKKGARSFIGYKRKYIFAISRPYPTKPTDDKLASLFLKPSNLIPTTLIKGHTVKEADRRSKEEMYRNYLRMTSSVASYEERYTARWLWGNMKSQVIIGDQQAVI